MPHIFDVLEEKDGYLSARFKMAYQMAEENWLRSLDPKNGFEHSCSVIRYLDKLIPDDVKERLTAAELFVLLYSTLLHDIGRKYVTNGHEKMSSDEILSKYSEFFLNEHEARAVAWVSHGHASEDEVSITSIIRDFGIDNLDPEKPIDLRFLAALLRLADEIDNSFTRVWGLPEHEDSERKKINYVLIDQTRWLIIFQHSSSTDEIQRKIILTLDKTQRRLDEIKEVLESRGVYYHLIDADPPLPYLRGYRALGDIRSYYLGRLKRSFMFVDPRGILQVRKVVKIKLEDIYIPLMAVPEGIFRKYGISDLKENKDSEKIIPSEIRQAMESREKSTKLSMKEILQHNRVVILGAPGSGKSTLIKYIVLMIAAENESDTLGLPWGTLPIIVSIRSYADALNDNSRLTLSEFLPLYCRDMDFCDTEEIGKLISIELEAGNCIVLLDGLDEIREHGMRIEVGTRIKNFLDEYGDKNKIMVTSRIAGYIGVQLPGDCIHYIISEFDDENIALFVNKWCLAFEEMTEIGEVAEKRAENEAKKLLDEINSNPGIRRLASNPLLLTILALVHYHGMRLPPRRVDLYELCVRTLAETWNLARNIAGIRLELWLGSRPLDERYLRTILGPVALWMHDEGKNLVEREELELKVAEELQRREGLSTENARETAADFLNLVVEYSGLLVEDSPNSFRFMHQTFQEYLAARTLAGRRDVNKYILSSIDDPRWREPILLTAASLEGDYADDFVRAIKNYKDRYEGLLHRHLIMAAWCLVDDAQISHALRNEIFTELYTIFTDPIYPLKYQINDIFAAMKGGSNEQDTLDILNRARQHPVSMIRSNAVNILGEIGGERAIEPLIEALGDPDSDVRSSAVGALGEIGGERVIDLLLEALSNPFSDVRSSAVNALGEIGGERVITILIEIFYDPDSDVRSNAAWALGEIGGERVIGLLLEALSDPDSDVRSSAVGALGEIGGERVIDLLLEALSNPFSDVRSSAVNALGEIGGERVIESLIEVRDDPNLGLRYIAAIALGKAGDVRVINLLIEALGDPDSDVRFGAVSVLGEIGDERAIEPIIEALGDPDIRVKFSAVYALGEIGGERAIEPLIEALSDPETIVRYFATSARREIGDERAIEPLIEALSDPEEFVRNNVAKALLSSINKEKN